MSSVKHRRPILIHTGRPFDPAGVPAIQKQLGLGGADTTPDDGSHAAVFSTRQQLPPPAEDWENKVVLVLTDRSQWVCQNEPFRTDEPISTFEDLDSYYTDGDADLTILHHVFPDLTATDVGKHYYDTYDNTFYRAVESNTGEYDYRHVGAAEALREVCHAYFTANEGGELAGDDDTRVLYLGEAHDDDNVTEVILPQHDIDLTTEYVVYFEFIHGVFKILTDYTPANSLVDHFVWNTARAEALSPVLRPGPGGIFPQPNETLFQAHAVLLDNSGHGWAIENVLHPGEEDRAVFAAFYSSRHDSSSDRGRENAVDWASGIEYKVGDRVNAGSANALYVCIQDHTSTNDATATGDPDDENSGYLDYWDDTQSHLTVPNRSHFRGVYVGNNSPSSPAINDWYVSVTTTNGTRILRWQQSGSILFGTTAWVNYNPFAHVLGAFASADEAKGAIRDHNVDHRTVAVINGVLNELTYYTGRSPDTHGLEWRSSRPTGNPVAVFYGAAMSQAGGRWQETAAGNKEDEGTSRLLRWHTTARESFYHGTALSFEFHAPGDVTGEDASVVASDILFSPEPGTYHVEMGVAGSTGLTTGGAYAGLYHIMSGTSDDQARSFVSNGVVNLPSNIFGEPDIEWSMVTGRRFLRVNDGDVFLAIASAGDNTSQWMSWEKID